MPIYIVKGSAILHNGARYEEGSEIELKDVEVRPLKHLLVKKVNAPKAPETNAAHETKNNALSQAEIGKEKKGGKE